MTTEEIVVSTRDHYDTCKDCGNMIVYNSDLMKWVHMPIRSKQVIRHKKMREEVGTIQPWVTCPNRGGLKPA